MRMALGQGLAPEIWCPGGTRAPETVATASVTAVLLDVVVVVQVDMMGWLVFGPAGRGCDRGVGAHPTGARPQSRRTVILWIVRKNDVKRTQVVGPTVTLRRHVQAVISRTIPST